MAQKNTNLHNAKRAKNDEFYTLLTDIEKEMVHYRDYFKGKVIYCNCDDARESNFFKFFANNFELLKIKKLITTGYKENGHGVVLEYNGDIDGDFMVGDDEVKVTELKGNGDFRSEECIEYLKQADIVITNPPFSLFREYVKQLMDYDKKFIIIGSQNAITYKEIFPYIKDNKLWLGYNFVKSFIQPNGEVKKFGNILWYTNIPHDKRNWPMDFYRTYKPELYPKYDNYDAIEVSKVADIPMDYKGVMGVPITFLTKYNPEQFQIVWTTDRGGDGVLNYLKIPNAERYDAPTINGKGVYKRILIRFKIVGSSHKGGGDDLILPNSTTYDPLINGKRKYYRIFIQRDLGDE